MVREEIVTDENPTFAICIGRAHTYNVLRICTRIAIMYHRIDINNIILMAVRFNNGNFVTLEIHTRVIISSTELCENTSRYHATTVGIEYKSYDVLLYIIRNNNITTVTLEFVL
jgi:hypothetical protein